MCTSLIYYREYVNTCQVVYFAFPFRCDKHDRRNETFVLKIHKIQRVTVAILAELTLSDMQSWKRRVLPRSEKKHQKLKVVNYFGIITMLGYTQTVLCALRVLGVPGQRSGQNV